MLHVPSGVNGPSGAREITHGLYGQALRAWQIGEDPDNGAVEFRVFFPAGTDPDVTAIRVGGNFQHRLGGDDWDFAGGPQLVAEPPTPDRTYLSVATGDLPAGFYEYEYLVEFNQAPSRIVTDPCTRYGGLAKQNSGVVVGGSTPQENQVRPLPGGRRPYGRTVRTLIPNVRSCSG